MLLYAILFVTGGAVLALELLASRIMTPYFGVSLYIWTGILSITLVALALGYWAGGRLAAGRAGRAPRRERLAQLYALMPAIAALGIVAACLVYPHLFATLAAADLVAGAFAAVPRAAVRAARRRLGDESAAGRHRARPRRSARGGRRRGQGFLREHDRIGRRRAGDRVRADPVREQLLRGARRRARARAGLAGGGDLVTDPAHARAASSAIVAGAAALFSGRAAVAGGRLHRAHVAGAARGQLLAHRGELPVAVRHGQDTAQRGGSGHRPLRPHVFPGRPRPEHRAVRRAIAFLLHLRAGSPGARLPPAHEIGARAGTGRRHGPDAPRRPRRGGRSRRDRSRLARRRHALLRLPAGAGTRAPRRRPHVSARAAAAATTWWSSTSSTATERRTTSSRATSSAT